MSMTAIEKSSTNEILFKPVIGEQELAIICDRIERIYARVRAIQADRADPNAPLKLISVPELMAQPLRSRLDAVDSDVDGLEYAVWCIGEALMATVGREGMDHVMGMIEDRENGTRIVSWLDHRWDGVTDGAQMWVA